MIWLDADPGDPADASLYRGRVEHVASATRAPFVSKEELFAFMERAVRGPERRGSEGEG